MLNGEMLTSFERNNFQRHSMSEDKSSRKKSPVKNPHLDSIKEDVLYHLGLTTQKDNLKEFADVKFVCVGGTPERMNDFAVQLKEILHLKHFEESEIKNISKSTRYAMFKTGPVLCVSHGIGSPSISVVLHEILKLLHHAGAQDPIFLRLGTSGGVGVPPGTVVITSESLNGLLKPFQELVILGEKVQRSSILDKEVNMELKTIANKYFQDYPVVVGKTMCADDFYEGQGRLDGAFCDYSNEEKLAYLKKLQDHGIVNIEMESITFAAMCRNVGLKGGVICVTMVDRLEDDQVRANTEIQKEWQQRVLRLASMYIKEKLNECL